MPTTTVKKMSKGYGYTYADMSTIHEEMERQNITYRQYVKFIPEAGADYIFTVLKYGDDDEMPALQGCRVIQGEARGMTAPQIQGSALTYARRYSLLMALGWAAEDDDGASAGAPKTAVTTKLPHISLTPNNKRLDFEVLKKELGKLNTLSELTEKFDEIGMTYDLSDKQRVAVRAIFDNRKYELGIQE